MSRFEQAQPIRYCSGERPTCIADELGDFETVGQRVEMTLHQGVIAAKRQAMEDASGQSLSTSGWSLNPDVPRQRRERL